MEDRFDKDIHPLAERYANCKRGMKELKAEMDGIGADLAKLLHRKKKNTYRAGGIVVTLEEVEKVKVTTGKSDDERED